MHYLTCITHERVEPLFSQNWEILESFHSTQKLKDNFLELYHASGTIRGGHIIEDFFAMHMQIEILDTAYFYGQIFPR